MTTPAEPMGVVQAIAKIMAEIPAIGKDGKADPAQGGYRYRGIEQITAAAQSLMARHGVIFAPEVTQSEVVDITVNNKPWTDTRLWVKYRIYGPDGSHIAVGPLMAIGRDNSDKGANKAITQAYKQALLQVFCVSDGKDDTDGSTHEADERHQPRPAAADWQALGYMDANHLKDVNDPLHEMWKALPEERKPTVKAWLKDQGYDRPVPVKLSHADTFRKLMEAGVEPELVDCPHCGGLGEGCSRCTGGLVEKEVQ